MMRPSPRQRVQGVTVAKEPRMVFWTCRTWPDPWQAGQVWSDVPGRAPLPSHVSQASRRDSFSVFSAPKAASSRVISRS